MFADVVAIDQMFVHDRLGAFNPGGMDVRAPPGRGGRRSVEAHRSWQRDAAAGQAPEALVLRVNAGDRLSISFTNWLTPATGPLPSTSASTRDASIQVVGLQIRNIDALAGDVGKNESSLAGAGRARAMSLRRPRGHVPHAQAAPWSARSPGRGGGSPRRCTAPSPSSRRAPSPTARR